jgi:multiple sugar transport system ATP-binding protein
MILSKHDGGKVIVGARSDAFKVAAGGGGSEQLSGRLRALEFHGHQWIAFIECGIDMLNPDFVGVMPTPRAPSPGGRNRHAAPHTPALKKHLSSLLSRARSSTPAVAEPSVAATHRRADLILEIDADAGLQTGTKVHLAVDPSRLHIFDESGRRVDRISR